MVTKVSIKGFEEFVKYTDNIDPNGPPVYFYFDSKLPDGTSWCPDCVVAEPIVRAFLREVKKDLIFVHVDCGEREFYRDPQCVFRTDPRSKIRRIPTLLKWQGDRLEETEVNDPENLRKLFQVLITP
ncbi:thioredoxin domain-containing protein 17-like [Cydia strobilella]|uniref:thioredoxin domain-containing protein 17-like n=1 Tax=Cydia strobilella TaxID=1100964 RepID=UPI0030065D6B